MAIFGCILLFLVFVYHAGLERYRYMTTNRAKNIVLQRETESFRLAHAMNTSHTMSSSAPSGSNMTAITYQVEILRDSAQNNGNNLTRGLCAFTTLEKQYNMSYHPQKSRNAILTYITNTLANQTMSPLEYDFRTSRGYL